MSKPATLPPFTANEQPLADGRRERSRSSRSKIVAAMLELVRNGDTSPNAARVAEVAGVGVRSVFRHFADMGALYREMGDAIEEQVRPLVQQNPLGETWQAKMRDIAQRRAQVFEAILPFRVSASLKRFQSPYLMSDYNRMIELELATISMHLPPAIAQDHTARHGLYLILSFQAWRALRHDQGLDASDAGAVMLRLLNSAIVDLPDT